MREDLSDAWAWRALLGVNIFFVLFGVSTAWFSSLPPSSIWGAWVGQHFFAGALPEDARVIYDFMRGPLGGTMAGSYLLQTFLVAIPLRRGEPWAWWAILFATLLWFLIDSAVSLAHGAWFNIFYINCVALLTMTALLVWFWRTTTLTLRRTE